MIDQRQKAWVGWVGSREEVVEIEKQQHVIIFAEVKKKKVPKLVSDAMPEALMLMASAESHLSRVMNQTYPWLTP